MERLDALQCQAVGICHNIFPSLESSQYAALVGLTCRLLDGEGCGNLVLTSLHISLDLPE